MIRGIIRATVRDGITEQTWSNAKGSGKFTVCEVFDEDYNKVRVTIPDRGGSTVPLDQLALLVPEAKVDLLVDIEGNGQFERATLRKVVVRAAQPAAQKSA